MEAEENGELPVTEAINLNEVKITAYAETINEYRNPKFDDSEYYNPADQIYNHQFELPEK